MVEVFGIFVEDQPLLFITQIVALKKLRNIALKHVGQPLVGIVRRPHDALRVELSQHLGQRLFFDFARGPYLARADIVAWLFFQQRRSPAMGLFEFLVHTVHYVGKPAGACLEKNDAQSRKALEESFEHHVCELS